MIHGYKYSKVAPPIELEFDWVRWNAFEQVQLTFRIPIMVQESEEERNFRGIFAVLLDSTDCSPIPPHRSDEYQLHHTEPAYFISVCYWSSCTSLTSRIKRSRFSSSRARLSSRSRHRKSRSRSPSYSRSRSRSRSPSRSYSRSLSSRSPSPSPRPRSRLTEPFGHGAFDLFVLFLIPRSES